MPLVKLGEIEFEGYNERKVRRCREWAARLSLKDKERIREFIAFLTLYLEDIRIEKRRKNE